MTEPIWPMALGAAELREIDEPFAGDLLGRQALAQRLTELLERLACGAVMALDAPWGEGKTWFARHWAAQLERDGWRVAAIDAFAQDYVEDPFLILAAEIKRLCATDDEATERFMTKASRLGSALLPLAAKATLNVAGKLVGTSDLAGDLSGAVQSAAEGGASEAQAWVKRRLEDHEKDKASVRAFREELAKFAQGAAQTGKPVVLLIDELDRCRPEFAVRLVERIKHFFDVPHLVFVLIMNRQQLERAIEGVYGAKTDGAAYLGKFLNLSLRLPKQRASSMSPESQAVRFVDATLQRYQYPERGYIVQTLANTVQLFDLSLRDVERICTMRFLSPLPWHGLLVFLCALQLKKPETFGSLARGESAGMTMLLETLAEFVRSGRWTSGTVATYLQALTALVHIATGNGTAEFGVVLKQSTSLLFESAFGAPDPTEALRTAVRSLEIHVE